MKAKGSNYLVYQLDSKVTTCYPSLSMSCIGTRKMHKENTKTTKIMPSSSAQLVESTSYDAVCATPFTQIHGRPTRHDYKTLKKEVADLASKVDNLTFAWSPDPTNGKEYGLLAKIIGANKYTHLTNQMWVQEVEPASYNLAITDATVTHMQKRMKEEWEEKNKSWYMQKSFLRDVVMNMQDALDKQ
jgi:hypothetical protein